VIGKRAAGDVRRTEGCRRGRKNVPKERVGGKARPAESVGEEPSKSSLQLRGVHLVNSLPETGRGGQIQGARRGGEESQEKVVNGSRRGSFKQKKKYYSEKRADMVQLKRESLRKGEKKDVGEKGSGEGTEDTRPMVQRKS